MTLQGLSGEENENDDDAHMGGADDNNDARAKRLKVKPPSTASGSSVGVLNSPGGVN